MSAAAVATQHDPGLPQRASQLHSLKYHRNDHAGDNLYPAETSHRQAVSSGCKFRRTRINPANQRKLLLGSWRFSARS